MKKKIITIISMLLVIGLAAQEDEPEFHSRTYGFDLKYEEAKTMREFAKLLVSEPVPNEGTKEVIKDNKRLTEYLITYENDSWSYKYTILDFKKRTDANNTDFLGRRKDDTIICKKSMVGFEQKEKESIIWEATGLCGYITKMSVPQEYRDNKTTDMTFYIWNSNHFPFYKNDGRAKIQRYLKSQERGFQDIHETTIDYEK